MVRRTYGPFDVWYVGRMVRRTYGPFDVWYVEVFCVCESWDSMR